MNIKIFIFGSNGDIGKALYNNQIQRFNVLYINSRNTDLKDFFEENINENDINIFVNCVGIGVYGMFDELEASDYQRSFEGNFLVPLNATKTFVQQIKNLSIQKSKKIQSFVININSKSANEAFAQGSAYNSMKTAISMVLKVIQKEYSKYGLKTQELFPGVIRTKMLDAMPYIPKRGIMEIQEFVQEFDEFLESLLAQTPGKNG